MNSPVRYGWRDIPQLVGLATGYVLLANISLTYLSPNGVVSIIWPPSGLGLAALLMWGRKFWPGVFIGAWVANVLAGSSVAVSTCIAVGNTLEAVFGYGLLIRADSRGFSLSTPGDFRKIALVGALCACTSALIGNSVLLIVGFLNWETLSVNLARWWQGDFLGILLVTPLILVWRRWPHDRFERSRWLESLSFLGLTLLIGQIIFLDWFHQPFGVIAFGYWMFLFETWGAVRFGLHGALLVATTTGIQALWGTTHGSGYFANDISQSSLNNLWFYLVVLTTLSLTLALTIHARERAEAELRHNEERYRRLAEDSSDWIWIIDVEGKHTYSNERVSELIGLEREAFYTTDPMTLIHPGDISLYTKTFRRAVEEHSGWRDVELRWRTRKGDYRTVESRASPMLDTSGRLIGFQGIDRDITERVRTEAKLRLAASVFANSYEGIMIADAENLIVDVNPAFSRITGYDREEVMGQPLELLASGRHGPEFFAEIEKALRDHDFWRGEIWNRRKSGEVFAEILAISVVRDPAGEVQHYISIFSDISLLKAHEAELQRIAYYDTLTGVSNRRLLADRLGQAMARARRTHRPIAVAYLDLDGFKPINDAYGHAVGDQLLIEITERLKGILRAEDTLARLGGDEFVVLVTDLEQLDECHLILERVLRAVSTPVLVNDVLMSVSASIGVTLYPDDEADADTLLRHADQAMYRAKEAGKNRYTLFDVEHDLRIQEHRFQLVRLLEAVANQEFVLYYQPKVDLLSGKVIGAEALIRWQHPEQGLLLPGAFLHYLDGNDLEIALGEWVIEAALKQIAVWNSLGLNLTVSVNVSAEHMLQSNFFERLCQILAKYPDVPPSYLEVEIVETAALADIQRAVQVLAHCRQLGVRFSLDDFGTGYSSLTYFRSLPVETLKVDQSFVRDMLDDPDDLGLVQSVVRLAHAFNRWVVAEGVETLEHAAMLVHLGCRRAQGYGIACPMPPEHLPDWVSQWHAEASWQQLAGFHCAGEDVTLKVAAQSHRLWIKKLEDYLENPEHELAMSMDSHHCRFGRWYHGGGSVRYGAYPEYQAIDVDHERIHSLGSEIITMMKNGQIKAARKHLPGLYKARDKLLMKIEALASKVRTSEGQEFPPSGSGL